MKTPNTSRPGLVVLFRRLFGRAPARQEQAAPPAPPVPAPKPQPNWGTRAPKLRPAEALRRLYDQAFGTQPLPRTREVGDPGHQPAQTEALLRAASNHLTRVGLLADTEWKVSLAFWAAQIASGAALISIAASDRTDLAYMIYRYCGVILLGYLFAAWAFVFAFSVNQSQSINTERNRYLYFENAALWAAGVLDTASHCHVKVMPGYAPLDTVGRGQSRLSIVWAMKLVSTTAFVTGAWTIAVLVAAERTTRPLDWSRLDPLATLNLVAALLMGSAWIGLCLLFYLRALRASR